MEKEVFKYVIKYLSIEELIAVKKTAKIFTEALYAKEIKSHMKELIFVVFYFSTYSLYIDITHRDSQLKLDFSIGIVKQ